MAWRNKPVSPLWTAGLSLQPQVDFLDLHCFIEIMQATYGIKKIFSIILKSKKANKMSFIIYFI